MTGLDAFEARWRDVFSPKRPAAAAAAAATPVRGVSSSAPAPAALAASAFSQADDADSDSDPQRDKTTRPIVGYWYLFSGALVFSIVALGGLTRLTESGLSIVEWNVIKGMKPPQSQQEWEEEFEKYKQFPEYKLLNHHMTLSEFKFIFYMEWAHRMLGRFIGLSFILPGAYFAYKGYMTRGIQRVSLVVATLIGMQGVLGWLMVKSGLSDELLAKPGAVPRVSHYWLTAHLGSAFIIYSIMVATGLRILRSNRKLDLSLFAVSVCAFGDRQSRRALTMRADLVRQPMFKSPSFKTFRASSHGVAGLVLLTALSGGLVAGLDAGLIYNEFPFMGNGIVPEDFWALSTQTDRNPHPISWFRNVLENPSAVQFNHRVLACTTFTAISALWVVSRRIPLVRPARIAINALLGVAVIQVTLGITTLLYLVPVPLAAAHQCGSLTLLTVALWLMHTLRVVPK
ncbi:Cytochrome c oxidase assembly protein cox15 [Polyrhizophydium stewartii]|uniref:Cytochrome c oxidase assembly protein cox15 n=1 Tax=Polyrhizophydium stewartii TaxID=2732419 RepID=A0ABR4NJA0_9FUNG